MEMYNENKVAFDELVVDGIKFVPKTIEFIQNESLNYLRYISRGNTDNYDNCDYVVAYINDECVGSFIGESINSLDVKEYAAKDDLLYSLRVLCAKDEMVLVTLLNYIKKLARARENRYIEINNEDKKYEKFYSLLVSDNGFKETINYIYGYVGWNLKKVVDKTLEIRHASVGEEYEAGGDATIMEDDEKCLGYVECDDLDYTYDMDYILGYDNFIKGYVGYLIGESIKIADLKAYNCYFIKDFFIYDESEVKYDIADKLFKFLLDLCEYRSCKYLKIKINDDKRYYDFYDYCKKYIGMEEQEGYLVKELEI